MFLETGRAVAIESQVLACSVSGNYTTSLTSIREWCISWPPMIMECILQLIFSNLSFDHIYIIYLKPSYAHNVIWDMKLLAIGLPSTWRQEGEWHYVKWLQMVIEAGEVVITRNTASTSLIYRNYKSQKILCVTESDLLRWNSENAWHTITIPKSWTRYYVLFIYVHV